MKEAAKERLDKIESQQLTDLKANTAGRTVPQ